MPDDIMSNDAMFNGAGQYIINNQKKGRLDCVLKELIPDISRTQLARWIKAGYIDVNGKHSINASYLLIGGEKLKVTPPLAQALEIEGENIPLDVLYEDEYLIVINKPAGMVVHPSPGHWQHTLVHGLIYHCGTSLKAIGDRMRPGIVHRLDKDTSGVMVAAKQANAHYRLCEMFARHDLIRRYVAAVQGLPSPAKGEVTLSIGRDPNNRLKMKAYELLQHNAKHIRTAKTSYEVIKSYALKAALVECTLETGRTHQIRVHMAASGYPVLGDQLYQSKHGRAINLAQKIPFTRQALHGKELTFDHPILGTHLSFKSDIPDDFANLLEYLEKNCRA